MHVLYQFLKKKKNDFTRLIRVLAAEVDPQDRNLGVPFLVVHKIKHKIISVYHFER